MHNFSRLFKNISYYVGEIEKGGQIKVLSYQSEIIDKYTKRLRYYFMIVFVYTSISQHKSNEYSMNEDCVGNSYQQTTADVNTLSTFTR